jgi:hypothetical protein
MLNQQMIANIVKRVGVKAGRAGLYQSLVEFKIKKLETQHRRGANFVSLFRQSRGILRLRPRGRPDSCITVIHSATLP